MTAGLKLLIAHTGRIRRRIEEAQACGITELMPNEKELHLMALVEIANALDSIADGLPMAGKGF